MDSFENSELKMLQKSTLKYKCYRELKFDNPHKLKDNIDGK